MFSTAGEYIKTWRRRWFVLKQGKIFWFKSDIITPVRQLCYPMRGGLCFPGTVLDAVLQHNHSGRCAAA